GAPGFTTRVRNAAGPQPQFVPEFGPVNWNGVNGSAETVSQDLNGDGTRGVLRGYEDWSQLLYSVRDFPDYADGSHPAAEISEMPLTLFGALNGMLTSPAPPGTGAHDLTLRRNGARLELYDNNARAVLASTPLATTDRVEVLGADSA